METTYEPAGKSGSSIANKKSEKVYSLRFIIVVTVIAVVLTAIIAGVIGASVGSNDSECSDESENSAAVEVDEADAYDAVIIGAGLTGLTNLYILSTASNVEHKTLMVERNNRIGGRTFTNYVTYNDSSIHFEMGAMRFVNWAAQNQLLHRLGLCDKVTRFEDTTSLFGSNNDDGFYLWRNHRKVIGDINSTNYWPFIYNFNDREIEWIEDGYDPEEDIFAELIAENGGFAPNSTAMWDDFWNGGWTLRGIAIRDWSEYAAYKTILNVSTEYWNYYTRTRKHSETSMALQFSASYGGWSRFRNFAGAVTGYLTLADGYSEQNHALFANVSAYEHNEFLFEHSVIGIEYAEYTDFKYKVSMTDNADGATKIVYTDKVISTVPPANLKALLPYFEPIDTVAVSDLVDSLVAYPAYKMSLIYDSEFWITSNLTRYHIASATDLEVQGLYVESVWTNGSLTCLHMYVTSDYSGNLWQRLQQLGEAYPVAEGMLFDNLDGLLVSSRVLVEEVVKQLRHWTKVDIPMPLAAFSNPMGFDSAVSDAWYQFKAGYVPETVIADIIRPIDDEDIYISQSDYSNCQGWANGAILAGISTMEAWGIENPFADEPFCDFSNV